MSKVFTPVAAVFLFAGLILAFFAPTDGMGEREAFFARLILIAPPLFVGTVLLALSRIIFLLETLQQNGLVQKTVFVEGEQSEEFDDEVANIKFTQSAEQQPAFDFSFEPQANENDIKLEQDRFVLPELVVTRSQERADLAETMQESVSSSNLGFEDFFKTELVREENVAAPHEPAFTPTGNSLLDDISLALAENEAAQKAEIVEDAVASAHEENYLQNFDHVDFKSQPQEPIVESIPEPVVADLEPIKMEDVKLPEATPGMAQAAQQHEPSRAPTIDEFLSTQEEEKSPAMKVVREGQFAGRQYRMFEDGSLEINTDQSTIRFSSLDEFRGFVSSAGKTA